jgi:hypothetical protein
MGGGARGSSLPSFLLPEWSTAWHACYHEGRNARPRGKGKARGRERAMRVRQCFSLSREEGGASLGARGRRE